MFEVMIYGRKILFIQYLVGFFFNVDFMRQVDVCKKQKFEGVYVNVIERFENILSFCWNYYVKIYLWSYIFIGINN